MSADEGPAITASVLELESLDPTFHWFCDRGDADGQHKRFEKEQKPLSVEFSEARNYVIMKAMQIYAFTDADAGSKQEFMSESIDKQLARCSLCSIEYHRLQNRMITRLHDEYEDDQVDGFEELFHEKDRSRIKRGLDTISQQRSSSGSIDQVKRWALHNLVEALATSHLLGNEDFMDQHFTAPFRLLCRSSSLRVPTFVPAMTAFLFDKDETRRGWAHEQWKHQQGALDQRGFDFATKDSLSAALELAVSPFPDVPHLQRLWSGIAIIIDRIDSKIFTHSLRALGVDICRLILDHFQFDNGPLFAAVLRAFGLIIAKAPSDFWEAMGSISPTTVLEQVFNSPHFDRSMQGSQPDSGAVSHAQLLLWILPLVESLKPGQISAVCRSMTFQLLERLQASHFSPDARTACITTGLEVLSSVLLRLSSPDTKFDTVIRVGALETLEITATYLDLIVQEGSKTSGGVAHETALNVIQTSLILECKLLSFDRDSLLTRQRLSSSFSSYSPKVWSAVTSKVRHGNILLARACLAGMRDLTGLERFLLKKEKEHLKEKEDFNEAFSSMTHQTCSLLERIADFDPKDLDTIFRFPNAATSLVASLFSADTNTYEAGVDLIKTISGESGRQEALRHLLQPFFETTVRGLCWAIRRISSRKTYAPCSRMLKTCRDVVGILCDVQDGLILRRSDLRQEQVVLVNELWEGLWGVLRTIYSTTEEWSNRASDPANMKDFCRETMEFSEYLFDQYSVFTNAVSETHVDSGDVTKPITNGDLRIRLTETGIPGTELLRQPLSAMEMMVKWLRLRDEYLASISVKLITKLLGRQGNRELPIAQTATSFLESVVVGDMRTVLTDQEKAQIAAALDDNAMVISAETTATHGFSEGTAGLKRDQIEHVVRTKPGTIDMQQWATKASKTQGISPDDVDQTYDQTMNSLTPAAEQFKRHRIAKEAAARSSKSSELAGLKSLQQPGQGRKAASRVPIDQNSFRQKREEERLAKKKRDAEALAKVKKNIPGLAAGKTSSEGSALKALGKSGMDHTPKGTGMMLSSDSESDSDDSADDQIFGNGHKAQRKGSVAANPVAKPQLHPAGPVRKQRLVRSAKDMRARLIPDLSTLHKAILSWDLFHRGDFPPGTDRHDHSQVTNSLRTPQVYRQTFEPLLLLEMWQDIRKGIEDGPCKSFEIKIANRISVDSFVEISTKMDAAQIKELELREADILLLSTSRSPTSAPNQPHCLARVHKVNRKQATIEVSIRVNRNSALLGQLLPNQVVNGLKITSITPPEREYGALLGLPYFDLCDEITRGKISPMLEFQPARVDRISRNYTLNPAQSKAVLSAIENDGFSLIQGPPGSGKTKTIVAVVGAILSDTLEKASGVIVGSSSARDAPSVAKKVLICAHSNAAVDELVMRLKGGVKTANGRSHKISVVRVGRGDKTNPNVLDVTLDELVERRVNSSAASKEKSVDEIGQTMTGHKATCDSLNALRAIFDEQQKKGETSTHEQKHEFELLKRQKAQLGNRIDQLRDSGSTTARDNEIARRRIRQEILDKAHVLCATLSGSGHDMFQALKLDFETVIIDEAAQCTELSALIPLKYGCSKCIMVGDPKQLPPTIKSRAALDLQYAQSLFERMQSNQPQDVHLLDTQYRMHPEISSFPSKAFYDGKLIDGATLTRDRVRPWHQNSLLGPYRFFNVAATHQVGTKGHSLVNIEEINLATALFQRLLADAGKFDFTGKVSIITPYTAQFRQMKTHFANHFGEMVLSQIEFNTTDAFQGRESEVVILSLVRGMGRGVGFLDDVRRMNVGLTRAKSSMWVLGNSNTLAQDATWNDMINDAKLRDRFTDMSMADLLSTLNIGGAPRPHVPEPQDIEMRDAYEASSSRRTSTASGISSSDYSAVASRQKRDSTKQHSGVNGIRKSTNHDMYTSSGIGPSNHHQDTNKKSNSCFRCSQIGHISSRCSAVRCLECGTFGHESASCTSRSRLTPGEKAVLIRNEAKHLEIVRKDKAKQEERIMGMHDRPIPPVKASATDPAVTSPLQRAADTSIPSKRKRGQSPETIDSMAARQASRSDDASGNHGRTMGGNIAIHAQTTSNAPVPPVQLPPRPPAQVRKKKEVDPFIRPKNKGPRGQGRG